MIELWIKFLGTLDSKTVLLQMENNSGWGKASLATSFIDVDFSGNTHGQLQCLPIQICCKIGQNLKIHGVWYQRPQCIDEFLVSNLKTRLYHLGSKEIDQYLPQLSLRKDYYKTFVSSSPLVWGGCRYIISCLTKI